MDSVIQTIIIALGTGFAGAFSGWFFSRKKHRIETIDYALETWQKVVDSLEARINVMLEEARRMRERMREVEVENKDLREQLSSMKIEISEFKNLQKKISKYECEIKALNEKIEEYKELLSTHKIDFKQ